MAHHDLIALWLMTSVASGLAAHLVIAALYRRSYRRLRAAYVGAVAEAQETGAAGALVQAQELHRQFMRASPPSWYTGLGVHVGNAFVFCAIAGLGLMIAMGRLPAAIGGVALLFAIGTRRILLATVLLVALFAATSMFSPPRRSDRTPTANLSAQPHAPKPLGRSR